MSWIEDLIAASKPRSLTGKDLLIRQGPLDRLAEERTPVNPALLSKTPWEAIHAAEVERQRKVAQERDAKYESQNPLEGLNQTENVMSPGSPNLQAMMQAALKAKGMPTVPPPPPTGLGPPGGMPPPGAPPTGGPPGAPPGMPSGAPPGMPPDMGGGALGMGGAGGPTIPPGGLQAMLQAAMAKGGTDPNAPPDQQYGDIKTGSDLVKAVSQCTSVDECVKLLKQYGPTLGPTLAPEDIQKIQQTVRQLAGQGAAPSGDPNAQAAGAMGGGM